MGGKYFVKAVYLVLRGCGGKNLYFWLPRETIDEG